MVCIPCIVIPVLLWVYKRFLEPIVYPFISPIIARFWKKTPITETKHAPAECNGTANGTTANGLKTETDKKAD